MPRPQFLLGAYDVLRFCNAMHFNGEAARPAKSHGDVWMPSFCNNRQLHLMNIGQRQGRAAIPLQQSRLARR